MFVEWPHIPNLPNLHRVHVDQGTDSTATYRAKVKLHGRNCAVSVSADGEVEAQSHHHKLDRSVRGYVTEMLAQEGVEAYFVSVFTKAQQLTGRSLQQVTVFGEWAGKGVQKFVAVSRAEPLFAVFAVLLNKTELWTEPEQILELLGHDRPANMHVLPWFPGRWTVDLSDPASVADLTRDLGSIVAEIDQRDPWAAEVLGIEGPGEGLVMYPEGDADVWTAFGILAFKVKGETHLGPKQIAKRHGVELKEPEVIETLKVGPRIEQAMSEVLLGAGRPLGKRDTPEVVRWVLADIERECVAEMEEHYGGRLTALMRRDVAHFVSTTFHVNLSRGALL